MASANSTNTPNKTEMTIDEKREMLADVKQTTVEQFRGALVDIRSPMRIDYIVRHDYFDRFLRRFLSGFGNNYSNRIAMFKLVDNFVSIPWENDDFEYSHMLTNMHFDLLKREYKRFLSEKREFENSLEEFVKGSLVSNSDSAIYQSFFENRLFERLTIPIIISFARVEFVLDPG